MKTFLSVTFALFTLAAPAVAETTTMKGEIPFSFTAGSQVLPAGEYTMTVDTALMRVIIYSGDAHFSAVVNLTLSGISRSAAKAQGCALQFRRLGAQYFLTGVWTTSDTDGLSVSPSRRYTELANAQAYGGEAVVTSATR